MKVSIHKETEAVTEKVLLNVAGGCVIQQSLLCILLKFLKEFSKAFITQRGAKHYIIGT